MYGKDINSSNFKLSFSVPESVSSVKPELLDEKNKKQGQHIEYEEKGKQVVWKIDKFKGDLEHSLNTKIT